MLIRSGQESIRCQAAVIGSGPGGAITACLLAERGKDVVMLEEGPDLPADSSPHFSVRQMVEKYRCGGLNPALGKAKIAFVEGECVGGGSEINSGLYHRTPPAILERWQRDFRVNALSHTDLAPHFTQNEKEICVSHCPGPAPRASEKLHAGASALKWCSMEVPRWIKYDQSVDEHGTPRGTLQSMTRTFVPRALQAGCRLLPGTRAQRLQRRSGGWRVDITSGRRHMAVEADTVFVCGGAVQSPALLRRSGIRTHIGNSLVLHPTIKAVAVFPEEINHRSAGVGIHQVKEFSPRMSFGCSISSPEYLALAMQDHGAYRALVLSAWRNMAVYYGMISGPAVGRIRNVPGSRDPIVRYALQPEDLRDLTTALSRLCGMLLAAGAVMVFPCYAGAPVVRGLDDLSRLPAAISAAGSSLMTIHLMSSCPMGEDNSRCPVDSFGRVRGVDHLRIHDASIFCTSPGVNPQGTVMALARRNTMQFLGDLS
jgi:choline dehydrogenase-like flavoprotein